jgi:hypothetical protein
MLNFPSILQILSNFGDKIDTFGKWHNSLGIPYLVIFLALWNAWEFRRNLNGKKLSPLHAIVSTLITGFGGSTITGNLYFKIKLY